MGFLVFLGSFLFALPVHGLSGEVPFVSRELHWAVTEEKFELALERLRLETGSRYRVPVILCHGFFVNHLFLNLSEERSLARHLARQGFDVWNLSLRGIGRSLHPLKNPPTSWTLDDMIDRDLPAVINYVRKESKSAGVSWVGYELGGLLGYGYLVKKGGSRLRALVAIAAPVTFNHEQQAPIKRLLRLEESPFLKKGFLYLNAPFLGRVLIPLIADLERLFYNPDNMAEEIKVSWLEETLSGINGGVLDHLLRMIKQGEFVSADGAFSYRRNLGRIETPLLLIGGEKDPLAPPEALRLVRRAVRSSERELRVFGSRAKDSAAYGHIDLILGKNAGQEVFPVIADWLKQRGEGG